MNLNLRNWLISGWCGRMYGEAKIVGRAVPMPWGCELGVKASGVTEGELVYEMDESVEQIYVKIHNSGQT